VCARAISQTNMSFADYFREKTRKLQVQYAAENAGDNMPKIFTDCVIYVDGYTEPSNNEIRTMVVERGGRFTLYLSSRVTHIVCENLPHSRIMALSGKDRVVRPKWIVDCCEQQRLLAIDDYVVLVAKSDPTQPSVFESLQKGKKAARAVPSAAKAVGEGKSESSVVPKTAAKSIVSTTTAASVAGATSTAAFREQPSAAEDPDEFVKHFYARSRLHHLSTWRQEIRANLAKFVEAHQSERRPAGERRQQHAQEEAHSSATAHTAHDEEVSSARASARTASTALAHRDEFDANHRCARCRC
jgi:DNA repair protein REV1